ncbi:hypothetical protein [Tunturibacter empetritectus]|uniref:Uncharacterized protein n=1 Tax=Tunturiibacter empetritectus TaxID=3069691 RepID=A0A7W8MQC4_9BACT|nr:hypothetical protein [Edaphobacter lichenicola]MBB5315655.1 hypothetical protein [Edaphobacter lichenicola]
MVRWDWLEFGGGLDCGEDRLQGFFVFFANGELFEESGDWAATGVGLSGLGAWS